MATVYHKTTGPLYIEPALRSGEKFLLLLSNQTGYSADVDVSISIATFSAADTPEPWVSHLTQTVTVPDETVANLVLAIPDYPYWIFRLTSDQDVLPCLYILKTLTNAVNDFPLVKAGEWIAEEEVV